MINAMNVEARKRDLVIRISDWTRDRDEPAYDVEIYIKGNYSGGEIFNINSCGGKFQAKAAAIAYAKQQIAINL